MATVEAEFLRTQLEQRRQRLQAALVASPETGALAQLLQEVDAALERMEKGSYGICEACYETIEEERLIADPLVRYCLTHLTADQQRALEEDLELASQIQRGLLPQQNLRVAGWQVHYHYEPAGPVSGDYCDLIHSEDKASDLYFLLGDVSGKGVSASLLMSQLHAMFRTLTTVGLPLDQLVGMANRVFCESTMAGHYATLVCGRAGRSGEVELANAGHLPALLVRRGEVLRLDATGLPLGMFCNSHYAVKRLNLDKGDSLFLYTDGLSETRDRSGAEYGVERLSRFVGRQSALPPGAFIASCLQDAKAHSDGAPPGDDLTLMVIRRE